jgi:N-acetylglucosaminyldiphosphoundecaprenol N-acetyl-beta-D-mannosaminyltransferase
VKFRFGQVEIAVTHPTEASALAEAAERLGQGRGFALATLNLDHLVKLRRDARFLRAYAAQDMVVADGNPIVWLSRLSKHPVALVPGSDLVVPLAKLAAAQDRPLAMVGSHDAALSGAAAYLTAQVPGLRIGDCIAPAFGFDPEGPDARDILAKLALLGPCICLLALGAPKQERIAALGRELAPEVGFASIGAGVDFLSGHQRRAPQWMRRLTLEWVWRIAQQPARLLPRYAACMAILPGQVAQALRQRRGR